MHPFHAKKNTSHSARRLNEKTIHPPPSKSPADGHTLPRGWGAHTRLLAILVLGCLTLARTRLAVQEAGLLHGTATLEPDRARVPTHAAGDLLASLCADAAAVAARCGRVVGARRGRGQVGDVLGNRVARPDVGDAYVGGFAGFTEGVVARVKIFAFLYFGDRLLE